MIEITGQLVINDTDKNQKYYRKEDTANEYIMI